MAAKIRYSLVRLASLFFLAILVAQARAKEQGRGGIFLSSRPQAATRTETSPFDPAACRTATDKCLPLLDRNARQQCFSSLASACDCRGCQRYCSSKHPLLTPQRCKDDFCPSCGSIYAVNGLSKFLQPDQAGLADETHYSVESCLECANACLAYMTTQSRLDCVMEQCGTTACRCDKATAHCLEHGGRRMEQCMESKSIGCQCKPCKSYCARRVKAMKAASPEEKRDAMYACLWRQCDYCTDVVSARGGIVSDDGLDGDEAQKAPQAAILKAAAEPLADRLVHEIDE